MLGSTPNVRRQDLTARLSLLTIDHLLGLSDAGIAYLAAGPHRHRWVEALGHQHSESQGGTRTLRSAAFYQYGYQYLFGPYLRYAEQPLFCPDEPFERTSRGAGTRYPKRTAALVLAQSVSFVGAPEAMGMANTARCCLRPQPVPPEPQERARAGGQEVHVVQNTALYGTSYGGKYLRGQWLRPASLLSTAFSAAVCPDESPAGDLIYIGTSMGLSALRGSDRHLLWHELLMMEIIRIIPEQWPLSDRVEQSAHTVSSDG